jgi:hypothetical protein
MVHGSLCAMGGMTPYPVLSALNHFPQDFGIATPKNTTSLPDESMLAAFKNSTTAPRARIRSRSHLSRWRSTAKGHRARRHLGDARRQDAGIQVPKLCATDSLEPFGSCRLCLVEIEGRKGFPASCTTPAEAA